MSMLDAKKMIIDYLQNNICETVYQLPAPEREYYVYPAILKSVKAHGQDAYEIYFPDFPNQRLHIFEKEEAIAALDMLIELSLIEHNTVPTPSEQQDGWSMVHSTIPKQ